jgi:hypothetical protein
MRVGSAGGMRSISAREMPQDELVRPAAAQQRGGRPGGGDDP